MLPRAGATEWNSFLFFFKKKKAIYALVLYLFTNYLSRSCLRGEVHGLRLPEHIFEGTFEYPFLLSMQWKESNCLLL